MIASQIWRRVPWPVRPVMTWFMGSTEEGSATSEFCATSPEVAEETGSYYEDCAWREPSPVATPELGADLWQRSAEWTGVPARQP